MRLEGGFPDWKWKRKKKLTKSRKSCLREMAKVSRRRPLHLKPGTGTDKEGEPRRNAGKMLQEAKADGP